MNSANTLILLQERENPFNMRNILSEELAVPKMSPSSPTPSNYSNSSFLSSSTLSQQEQFKEIKEKNTPYFINDMGMIEIFQTSEMRDPYKQKQQNSLKKNPSKTMIHDSVFQVLNQMKNCQDKGNVNVTITLGQLSQILKVGKNLNHKDQEELNNDGDTNDTNIDNKNVDIVKSLINLNPNVNQSVGGGKIKGGKLECQTCGRTFNRKFNLKVHEETHSTTRERKFCCPVEGCDKKFFRSHELMRHNQVHLKKEQKHASA
ncbi:hypothetical protein HK099_003542 [Clydaea vesicula]|uniref:C2H2-type domain-containing protein n=1 Tax=Clydaea vesicula TaxID=447962 RepID=A0AAD5U4X9_9FUNG|nr:hypothetical protein HK099_003542 [Clydaea vesicula]KAJ3395642.1 hypothetical protein HDU92_005268 [Lobulomyces angularis]